MSVFKVNVIASNPKNEALVTPPIEALVDTGSELTWFPAELLRAAGITPRRKRTFATATQERVERDVGYAILSAEGYETNDEVVFAEPGDFTLLGVRTIEGFGVMVDNIGHRFVTRTTIVAAFAPRTSVSREPEEHPRCSMNLPAGTKIDASVIEARLGAGRRWTRHPEPGRRVANTDDAVEV